MASTKQRYVRPPAAIQHTGREEDVVQQNYKQTRIDNAMETLAQRSTVLDLPVTEPLIYFAEEASNQQELES